MTRLKLTLFVLCVLIGSGLITGYLIPKNTPIVAHFLNKNSIDIEVKDGLDMDNIRIELSIWGTEHEDVVIVEEGSYAAIPKGYGENDWFLAYGTNNHGVFRHFNTNNWHDHHYSFVFYQKNGEVLCDAQINGPDQMDRLTIHLDKAIKTDVGSASGLRITRK